jgi:hypothetical protein
MTMKNPFAIHPRPISASVNRVRVALLPAVVQDESLIGRTGYELLSSHFVLERIQRHMNGLRLPAHVIDVLPAFNGCFTSDDPVARLTAKQIAVQYGRSLATVLLTLKEGHPTNRAARSDWGDEQWAFWQQINTVWLGGGLIAGAIGPLAVAEAHRLISKAGYDDYQLAITPNPGHMTLIGAATAVTSDSALLIDFGQSRIKRGVGFFDEGKLQKLHLFHSVPAACGDLFTGDQDDSWAEAQLWHMTAVLRSTWQQIQDSDWQPQQVVAAIASDLHNGHPLGGSRDCYGRIQYLVPNLQEHLAQTLQEITGQAISFRLMQDANAAAMVYKGDTNTAVLTLGTAVGIGFPDDVNYT